MTTIAENLQSVRQQIAQAAIDCGRDAGEITLLAVSKKKSVLAIRDAYFAGQRQFGENYVQEGISKIVQLRDLAIEWHFIGSIQSNKAAMVAQHFSWVHTVDRIKTANLLNDHRPSQATALNVCIQVNLDGESSKSGVTPEDCLALAQVIQDRSNLSLRGLMAIPQPEDNYDSQLKSLTRLTNLKISLEKHLSTQLDTLSMGMSADLTAAIHAGSTLVRVGQAIFGARL